LNARPRSRSSLIAGVLTELAFVALLAAAGFLVSFLFSLV
jgi:hypothetical protein